MSKFKLLSFVLPAALLCTQPLCADEITTTVLHDTFGASGQNAGLLPDGNGYRSPTSTQAVYFGGGTTPSYTSGTSIKLSAGNRGLLGYFQPSTSLANVDIGETLTVAVTFKYSGGTGASSTGDFRLALLNSNGNGGTTNALGAASRIVADSFSLTAGGDTPRGYSGYAMSATAANTAPASNSLTFWRRDPTLISGVTKSQQWLGPTSSDIAANTTFVQVGSPGGGTIGAVQSNGSLYVAKLAVTPLVAAVKNGDGVVTQQAQTKLTFSITNGGATVMSYTATENADSAVTGFDAFFILSLYNAALEVTDLLVTKTSVSLGIVSQPASKLVAAGTSTSLTVTAVGAPAPTYQWQKDGANLAGATSSTLSFASVAPADAGVYRVVVTNPNGSVTSDAATLTVATTPVITQQPSGPTIFEGVSATMSVTAVGRAPLAYQWLHDGQPVVDDAIVSGSATPTLNFTAARLTDAGAYTVSVSNADGSVLTAPATLTVYSSTPPSFTTQPAGQSVPEGSTLTFTATVDGPPPFTYQWRKDGVNLVDDGVRISGATSATLTLSGVRFVDAGVYTLFVRNPASTAISADAVLAVTAAPVPGVPAALSPRNLIQTSFTARWSTVNYATGYRLDLSTDPTFVTFVSGYQDLDVGPAATRSITGLSVNTTYYYRVRAYNSTGASGSSNVVSALAQYPVAPVFTSLPSTTFTVGVPGSFTFTASGAPQARFSATGLPAWASLESESGLLSGTPPAGIASTTVTLSVTAQNDTAPNATQTFVINILALPTAAEPLTITTLAGVAGTSGTTDGSGTGAKFNAPSGIAVDGSGNVFVADAGSHLIRKVTAAGAVTTLAGKAGTPGSADGTGTAATFDTPSALAIDSSGNIYVADTLNHVIRKITSAGVVTTFSGKAGTPGSADGAATAARFFAPQGLALAAGGTDLYVADTNNHTLRKVALATGAVTTLAGQAGSPGSANGVGSAARFNAPSALAVDKNGNLYVADTDNGTIRAVTSAGAVATLAGLSGSTGATDGSGASARFNHPAALAVDSAFDVYVLDTDNHTVRKIVSAAGAVTTIAGQAGTAGTADGLGTVARFKFPAGITISSSGDLYIADTNNHTIRTGQLPAAPEITVQPQSQSVTVGGSVTFSVKATGRPDVTYQWYLNGGPVTGGSGATLSIANAQSVNAGDYTVIVSNVVGSVTSSRASLVINPIPTEPVGISGTAGKGGSGGAPSDWFYLALALLVGARALTRRRSSR